VNSMMQTIPIQAPSVLAGLCDVPVKPRRELVYANRRRLQRPKGKQLLRKRGELIERTFAHCYETGGMRRTHLRKHGNILKRLLIHVAGANLGLLLRTRYGSGTPRSLQGLSLLLRFLVGLVARSWGSQNEWSCVPPVTSHHAVSPYYHLALCCNPHHSKNQKLNLTTDC